MVDKELVFSLVNFLTSNYGSRSSGSGVYGTSFGERNRHVIMFISSILGYGSLEYDEDDTKALSDFKMAAVKFFSNSKIQNILAAYGIDVDVDTYGDEYLSFMRTTEPELDDRDFMDEDDYESVSRRDLDYRFKKEKRKKYLSDEYDAYSDDEDDEFSYFSSESDRVVEELFRLYRGPAKNHIIVIAVDGEVVSMF